MTTPEHDSRRLSDSARIALAVMAFGLLSLALVLLGNGGGVTSDLGFEATDLARTVVADAVLSPPAPVAWTFYETGRRQPVHDLIFVEDTLYAATDAGLLILTETGEFAPAPGFPAGAVPTRLWIADGILWAGLEDGQAATSRGGAWDAPFPVALVFPPLFRLEEGFTPDEGFDLDAICAARGMISAADGALWIACPDSVARWQAGALTRYTRVDGLPGSPTGALRMGPDGRLWVGLENGLVALAAGD